MREAFQEELRQFIEKLTQLGHCANEAIHKSLQAFNEGDRELAREVVADDLKINMLATEIEQQSYRIIVLQQPVATDLRKVFAVLLASSDVERLADHAASISRTLIRRRNVDVERVAEADEIINAMAVIVQEMLDAAIHNFTEENPRRAREIAARDDEVDHYLNRLYTVVTSRLANTDAQDMINLGIDYIGMGNNLERIGDYITNICERIVYLDSGDIVELD